MPFPNSIIYKGNVFDLENFIVPEIDIVVAGELIEHLNDPQMFLNKIKSYKGLENKKLIITTPNACTAANVIMALFGRESMHKDHVNIFSYKTLNTICKKTEMKYWEIIPYYSVFPEMILNSHGLKKFITFVFEKLINILQFLFPLLSGGWILIIDI
jgi:2-polyprenyl-3-methyl-5-hydroxy-6-metoxy-1,4-benzoquinol methylase